MSYRPMFEFANEPPAGNAQRFATEAEAEASARVRFLVWTMPTGYHVAPSEDPVNYRHENGEDISI